MKLNIEEQVPVKCKLLRANQIQLPKDFREGLNMNVGDILELYGTTEGIFIRKEEV